MMISLTDFADHTDFFLPLLSSSVFSIFLIEIPSLFPALCKVRFIFSTFAVYEPIRKYILANHTALRTKVNISLISGITFWICFILYIINF